MPPENAGYDNCYLMMSRDDGTTYETIGQIEEVTVDTHPTTVWADNIKYLLPSTEETLTVRLLRDRSCSGKGHRLFTPRRIIRNGPALVVFWQDGTKTVVKCHDEDFDAEKGLAMALCRKLWGRCQTKRFLKMVDEQR